MITVEVIQRAGAVVQVQAAPAPAVDVRCTGAAVVQISATGTQGRAGLDAPGAVFETDLVALYLLARN